MISLPNSGEIKSSIYVDKLAVHSFYYYCRFQYGCKSYLYPQDYNISHLYHSVITREL